jgi:hypothetical protein
VVAPSGRVHRAIIRFCCSVGLVIVLTAAECCFGAAQPEGIEETDNGYDYWAFVVDRVSSDLAALAPAIRATMASLGFVRQFAFQPEQLRFEEPVAGFEPFNVLGPVGTHQLYNLPGRLEPGHG